jgi:uridine kinase
MRGDILIISDHHRQAAEEIINLTLIDIKQKTGKYFFTVAGESGAGKSEIAYAIEQSLEKMNIPAYIIQQDDYFHLPPKTNENSRILNINQVGPGEVRLDLLNETINALKEGKQNISKPLVIFEEDRITEEVLNLQAFKVIIIEGTYTTLVDNIDCHVFIDRNRDDTREDRLKRNREKQNDYLERILEIEHNIISRHKDMADIIINKEFKVSRAL